MPDPADSNPRSLMLGLALVGLLVTGLAGGVHAFLSASPFGLWASVGAFGFLAHLLAKQSRA